MGSNGGNIRDRSGALPYHLVEAIEKGGFGSPPNSVGQFDIFLKVLANESNISSNILLHFIAGFIFLVG